MSYSKNAILLAFVFVVTLFVSGGTMYHVCHDDASCDPNVLEAGILLMTLGGCFLALGLLIGVCVYYLKPEVAPSNKEEKKPTPQMSGFINVLRV